MSIHLSLHVRRSLAVFTAVLLVTVTGNISLRRAKINLPARVILLDYLRHTIYDCLILIMPLAELEFHSILLRNMTGACVCYPLPSCDMIRTRNILCEDFCFEPYALKPGGWCELKSCTRGMDILYARLNFDLGKLERKPFLQLQRVSSNK